MRHPGSSARTREPGNGDVTERRHSPAALDFAATEPKNSGTTSFDTFWLADPNKTDEPVPQREAGPTSPALWCLTRLREGDPVCGVLFVQARRFLHPAHRPETALGRFFMLIRRFVAGMPVSDPCCSKGPTNTPWVSISIQYSCPPLA